MNIDKDIERCKELINGGSWSEYITTEQSKAIENVLLELEKKDNIINLMSRSILNYDDQLVINKYRNKEEVKKYFEENYEELMKRYDR